MTIVMCDISYICFIILQFDFVSYVSYYMTCNLIVCALYEYLHEANKDYY